MPADLQLSEWDIVQPGLMVVLARNQTIITPTRIKGSPDLVVEILSASSVHNDRVCKMGLYRKSAIPEYWVVDPDQHVVEQFVLRDGAPELVDRHAHSVTLQKRSKHRE